jgi:fibronectin-binding autotransporter adhesin
MCRSERIVVAIAAMLLVFRGGTASAANIYWDGLGTSWNTTADWSTASNATTPHPAAVPGSGDEANFNISTVNTAQTVNLDAAQSALGLTFTSTGTVTINSGVGTNTLTIGLGGITGAGGSGLDTINANVTLGIPETWTNNSVNALTVNGNITNGSNTLTIGGSGTTNLNGILGNGSGGLTMSGTGTLNLGPTAGTNTYTGATTVSSGTLLLNSSSGFGLSAGVTIAAGATLDLDGIAGSTNITSIAGTGVGGNGALVSSFPFIPGVWSGNVTLAGDTTIGGTGDIPLSGAVTGNGHALIKVGTKTLTLSGSTDNSGFFLTVDAGTVVLAKTSSASVHAVGSNGLNINGGAVQLGGTGGDQINDGAFVDVNGGTFGLNGRSETIGALVSAGGTTGIVQNASATAAALTINMANGGLNDYVGVLQDGAGGGALSLIIGGNGEELLAGNNTFTGGVTINAGFLTAGSAGALNSAAPNAITFGPGSTGVLNVSGHFITVSGLNTNATTVGTPVVQNFGGLAGVLNVSNSGPNTYAGVIQDGAIGAPLSLTKNSSGVLILSGANTYTGATTVNGGSLQGGAANTIPAGSAVVLGVAGTLDLGGFAQSIGSLASTFGGAVTTEGAAGSDTLAVGNDNTSTAFAGAISNATGGRKLALTKVGTGTLTLSGNNTFSGPINVLGGTLALSGGTLVADVHNQATFAYGGGTFAGRLFNVGGAITTSAPLTVGNGLENDGSLAIPAGQTITLGGLGLDNEGSLTIAGGTLNLSGSGSANNLNRGSFNLSATVPFSLGTGTTLTNAGTLNLNGGLLNGSGTLLNNPGGIITGNGTIQSNFSNTGGSLIVGDGTINIAPALTNNGLIQLTAAGSDLVGGAITNAVTGTIQGIGVVGNAVTNNGTIAPLGGNLLVAGMLANPAGGLVRISSGNELLAGAGLVTNAGIINLVGGTFDNSGHGLNNTGQISGFGIFATGGAGLDNNGSITFSGGLTTVNGPVTNEGGHTITVAQNPAIFTGLVTNNMTATFNVVNTTATFAGGFVNNGNSNFAKAGGGTVEVDSAPTLNNGSTLSVTTGTLRFNVVSGTPTIGTGVTAVVSSGATLELAGSVSALANGANRVNITNNSNAPGVLVTGTHQQVGAIDGSGTTQVNAGSDLTANHIIQSALVIGGTAKNPGLLTIDASDASGNPLSAEPLIIGSPIEADSLGEGVHLADATASTVNGVIETISSRQIATTEADRLAAVPEPSSLLLIVLGGLIVGGSSVYRRIESLAPLWRLGNKKTSADFS